MVWTAWASSALEGSCPRSAAMGAASSGPRAPAAVRGAALGGAAGSMRKQVWIRGLRAKSGGWSCRVMSVTPNSSAIARVELELAEVRGEQQDARRATATPPRIRTSQGWSRWMSRVPSMLLEFEKVGASRNIRSYGTCPEGGGRIPRETTATPAWRSHRFPSHSRQSARMKLCCGPESPFSSRLRAGPLQVDARKIDGGGRRRPACGRVDRCRAGVGEEVQESGGQARVRGRVAG